MNKKIGLIILIAVVVLIVVGVSIFGISKLFQSKEMISADKFKTIMEDKGFAIIDAKSQFSNVNYIENAYIAAKADYSYKMEFYEISDESSAISFYNNNKNIFETYKSTASVESSINMKNNSKYTLKTSDKYRVLSRVENTVLYIAVDVQYKDEVDEIIKDLGY